MAVEPEQVRALLSDRLVTEEEADQAIGIVTALVAAYTRDRHVRPDSTHRPGIDEVILTAAARLITNPGQISGSRQIGQRTESWGIGFQGFTLVELAVLNRYRKRAS